MRCQLYIWKWTHSCRYFNYNEAQRECMICWGRPLTGDGSTKPGWITYVPRDHVPIDDWNIKYKNLLWFVNVILEQKRMLIVGLFKEMLYFRLYPFWFGFEVACQQILTLYCIVSRYYRKASFALTSGNAITHRSLWHILIYMYLTSSFSNWRKWATKCNPLSDGGTG